MHAVGADEGTDPPEATEKAVRAIKQRGAQLYWLHPNKEIPSSASMLRCRDWIDGFLPVDNLHSLQALAELGTGRFSARHLARTAQIAASR